MSVKLTISGVIQPDLKQGVEAYLDALDGREDRFQSIEGHFHFPCSDCIHNQAPEAFCRECRHFVK